MGINQEEEISKFKEELSQAGLGKVKEVTDLSEFVLKDNGTGFRAVPPASVTVATRGGRRSSPQAFPPRFPTHGTGVPDTRGTPALGAPSRQQRREGAGPESNFQPAFHKALLGTLVAGQPQAWLRVPDPLQASASVCKMGNEDPVTTGSG